jgi:hypothetical protein
MIGTAKRRTGAIRNFGAPGSRAAGPRIGVVAAVALLALTGCGEMRPSALVSPGKYERYPCQNILDQIKTLLIRQAELKQLMARADEGFGGAVVNVLAYRGEHRQISDDLKELVRTAEEKQCRAQTPLSSDRAVF